MREMKNSGVAWIGDVPKNWEIVKIGQLFQCRNVKVNDTDFQPLSVSKGGIVPQMENVAKSDANDNRKQVLTGDFVINSRSDRKQSCGVSKLDGSVSLINTVLYNFDKSKVIPEYNNYLLKNYGFAEEFYRWGHGIVADLWTTGWQEMKNIEIPVPSIKIQEDILSALRIKSKNISLLIFNQEQQIEKLKQYKQSLITEVVTKGLNHDVPMKDSGTLKLGSIPYNWKIVRFKNVAILCNGKEVTSNNGNIPVYGSGGVFKYTDQPLFTGTSLLLGRKGTIDNPMLVTDSFWTVDTMFYTSKIYGINPKYLYYACVGEIDFNYYKTGSVLPSMTQTEINNIFITCPDKFEQKKIVDFLDKKCTKIDRLIAIKQEKINKLNDYKKSLIYEYVTGKKEVC